MLKLFTPVAIVCYTKKEEHNVYCHSQRYLRR